MEKFKNVVWDWNGTLLNDLQAGVDVLNDMLGRRGVAPLNVAEYQKVFGFPVIDFYKKVGFDFTKETFHEMSVDFVETYARYEGGTTLNNGVVETLDALNNQGINCYILSALRQEELLRGINTFNIAQYFKAIYGGNDIYASGKVGRGLEMVGELQIDPAQTIMVGDTLHDAEVAEALGFTPILYSGGHNDKERLSQIGRVIDDFQELLEIFKEYGDR